MQILFEEEKASLIEQHKHDERALSDMEDRLKLIRRRELEIKEEYNTVYYLYKKYLQVKKGFNVSILIIMIYRQLKNTKRLS